MEENKKLSNKVKMIDNFTDAISMLIWNFAAFYLSFNSIFYSMNVTRKYGLDVSQRIESYSGAHDISTIGAIILIRAHTLTHIAIVIVKTMNRTRG